MQKIHSTWEANQERIASLLDTEDISNFLTWDPIKGTMFVDYGTFTVPWLHTIMGTSYEYLLKEPPFGNPRKSEIWECSYNRIAQVSHFKNYETISSKKVKDFDHIIEFGGGYGSLCEIIHKSGFKGKYTIYDIPRMSEIQSYYLASCGLSVRLSNSLPVFKTSLENSMFISNWAISESPKEVQDFVFNSEFFKGTSNILMAVQNNFNELDNVNLIKSFQGMSHSIPNLSGSMYIIK